MPPGDAGQTVTKNAAHARSRLPLGRAWVASFASYRAEDLSHDAFAAAVLTSLLIPAGMGYAELAGLPAVTGLHATVVALVVYALAGPSRIMIVGPDSSLAPIIAVTIAAPAAGDPDRAVALAGLLGLLTGAVLLAGGLLRLGFVMDALSKPIRLGYLIGVALTVVTAQLPKLFGFSAGGDGVAGAVRAFVEGVSDGRVVGVAAVIGLAALATILGLRRLAPRVP
ncbi:MAG TPA: SulP family inorganic anion transporter, partial [Acidimicrobiia bacterium]|nr:SulP family inorganic anion transporter [Acidimicrobiia bacterium]